MSHVSIFTTALALAGGLLFVASAAPTAPAADNCPREALFAAADAYVVAQRTGKLDRLPLAGNFTYRENNKVMDIHEGVLGHTALAIIDNRRSTADTVACASFTMLIAASDPMPYVLATQIRHAQGDATTITMIDTIAATTGSLFFNATKTLHYVAAEDWKPLPVAVQPDRALLRHVGDAYLDMWTNKTAANSIPWGSDCERVEGSSLTRPCDASLPHGGSVKRNSMRRYVLDPVMGSVDVLDSFDSLGKMPDSHEVRVVDGKVKYVITVTV